MQTYLLLDPATGRGIGSSQTSVPGYEPHEHEVPCTLEQFAAPKAWMLQDGALVPAPAEPPPVPGAVSSVQAQIQLLRIGLLAQVKALVAEGTDEVKLWFDKASSWQRTNPYVVQIGTTLGLTSTEIDDLFRAAALIEA
ncbi:hypothetical protein [Methylobacterium organophilum]|uniref:Uncharacterized protein n=1 Tax=Methylobacterium organophilum TaxID=410 RepID=A0ABQ4T9M9_METOR|nr:hypothetical protein [Methylobacterium organophilum]GJE27938.1 hypothetical protein LKMONMHP_2800 [Methylobacterium organophilum]